MDIGKKKEEEEEKSGCEKPLHNAHCTIGGNDMKSICRHTPLSHKFGSERANERTNERSIARGQSEQCGASE